MNANVVHVVGAVELAEFVRGVFEALGTSALYAKVAAESLVSADLDGHASHGVALLPMYLERIAAGSVSATALPRIVDDLGALVVLTAADGLGQVSSQVAIELAADRAAKHGVATVAVRDAFHFGAGAFWTRQLADKGMVGMAFSNTRPLMPAPGGAQQVVGNNPMCIAFPSESGKPLIVDMAMSASAMGKIRVAESRGETIPLGWATDASGQDTTSPSEAIKGLLLPAAGPKGFGLAVAIDLLCGAISGGGIGSQVKPLYGNAAEPYNCAHTFIAIDASRLNQGKGIATEVDAFSETIRGSRKAPDVERVFAPGDLERYKREQSQGRCVLTAQLKAQLDALATRYRLRPIIEL